MKGGKRSEDLTNTLGISALAVKTLVAQQQHLHNTPEPRSTNHTQVAQKENIPVISLYHDAHGVGGGGSRRSKNAQSVHYPATRELGFCLERSRNNCFL